MPAPCTKRQGRGLTSYMSVWAISTYKLNAYEVPHHD